MNNYDFKYRVHLNSITLKYKNNDVESLLTELKVRKRILKLCTKNSSNIVKLLKKKLLIKSLKIGNFQKKRFYCFLKSLRDDKLISDLEFFKICLIGYIYVYSGRGKELFKKML